MANGGGRDDDLDKVVLDEDFVRGATVTELDAKHRRKERERREKEFARQNRKYRRGIRRARLRRRIVSYRTATVLVAMGALALAVPGLNGIGPLSYLGDKVWPSERDGGEAEVMGAAATATTVAGATSTTLDQRLERRSYKVGDCVWWDEANERAYTLDTKVVDCGEAHVLEVTGRHLVTDKALTSYPTESYWDALFDTGPCLTMAETYLKAKLDPNGNYYSHGVMPSPESWLDGDREVYCGIGVVPYDALAAAAPGHAATTGRVAADRQFRIYGVGSCLGTAGTGANEAYGAVPCDQPHRVEVSGHVDIRGRTATLPAEGAYRGLVGDDCLRLGRAYAGRNLRDPVSSGWLWIEPASWDAGERTVMCTVAEYRGGEAATITRKLGV